MLNKQRMLIRGVQQADRRQISDLVSFGKHVHRHLDWIQAVGWIGYRPFVVVEWQHHVIAALACPPDPEGVAWLRLFAVSLEISLQDAWSALWSAAEEQFEERHMVVASIPSQMWFRDLLTANRFEYKQDIITLQWDHSPLPPIPQDPNIRVRTMKSEDLPKVFMVDREAFAPIWQHSVHLLENGWSKSSIATVAEISGEIVGYQISTANASGGHLARLAVLPAWQGRGIGFHMVHQLLTQFRSWRTLRVTVNTQADNIASTALYKKFSFKVTGEAYPVLQLSLP